MGVYRRWFNDVVWGLKGQRCSALPRKKKCADYAKQQAKHDGSVMDGESPDFRFDVRYALGVFGSFGPCHNLFRNQYFRYLYLLMQNCSTQGRRLSPFDVPGAKSPTIVATRIVSTY